jgi:glycopeptide antibiotics resistance protein
MSRRAAAGALAAYVVVLVAVTLGRSPGEVFVWLADVAHDSGLESVTTADAERTANIVLFVPAGLLLCYALPTVRRSAVWALCVATSLGIEAVQYVLPTRDSSVIDVVTNSTGAALGILIHWLLTPRRMRSRP